MSSGSKKFVACFYTWEKAVILNARIENREIFVDTQRVFKNFSIDSISELLEVEKAIWINKHAPLALALKNKCIQIDFQGDDIADENPMLDLFQSLKSQSRFHLSKQIKLLDTDCLKLLMKATMDELIKPRVQNVSYHVGGKLSNPFENWRKPDFFNL